MGVAFKRLSTLSRFGPDLGIAPQFIKNQLMLLSCFLVGGGGGHDGASQIGVVSRRGGGGVASCSARPTVFVRLPVRFATVPSL